MLVVLVLQQLTELTKGLVAVGTVVGEIGDASSVSIREHGNVGCNVALHASLLIRKFVNLTSRIVGPKTTRTITTLNVLHRIGPGPEASFMADGTRNVSWTMRLCVHVELILSVKVSEAFVTGEGGSGISSEAIISVAGIVVPTHTVFASRISITLEPLVP